MMDGKLFIVVQIATKGEIMGCDIHIRLEKMNKEGEWESIDYYKIREDWEDSKKYHPSTFPFFPVDIYDGRDYELFGILAGVRSSYPNSIVEPRGIPDSANHFVKDEYEASKDFIHTPSWLTLGELRKTWYAHMDDDPKDEDGCDNVYIRLLEGIIKPIEYRLADLWFVFAEDDVELEEACRKYWNTVRIVFWFDN